MYSRALPYDYNTINIQSDLERSRRFGSGVYPDYSRGTDPVRNNISTASPAQRNMHQTTRQEGSSSRDPLLLSVIARL